MSKRRFKYTESQLRYQEFLKSDFWIYLSAEKVRTIGHCENCNSKQNLQSHHKFYRTDWYETELQDLMVLCRKCHQNEHGLIDDKRWNSYRKTKNKKSKFNNKEKHISSTYNYHGFNSFKPKYVSYNDYAKSKYGEHYHEIIYTT